MMQFTVRGNRYKTKRCRIHFLGMMFRSWKRFDAMFFKMPTTARWGGVWMPFCPKMDVLFLRKNKVTHKENAIPMTLDPRTWKIYTSPTGYDSILEVKPDNNIKKGDLIEWSS